MVTAAAALRSHEGGGYQAFASTDRNGDGDDPDAGGDDGRRRCPLSAEKSHGRHGGRGQSAPARLEMLAGNGRAEMGRGGGAKHVHLPSLRSGRNTLFLRLS